MADNEDVTLLEFDIPQADSQEDETLFSIPLSEYSKAAAPKVQGKLKEFFVDDLDTIDEADPDIEEKRAAKARLAADQKVSDLTAKTLSAWKEQGASGKQFNTIDYLRKKLPFASVVEAGINEVRGVMGSEGEYYNSPAFLREANNLLKNDPEKLTDKHIGALAQRNFEQHKDDPETWLQQVGQGIAASAQIAGEIAATGGGAAIPEMGGALLAAGGKAVPRALAVGATNLTAKEALARGALASLGQAAVHAPEKLQERLLPSSEQVEPGVWKTVAGDDPGLIASSKAFYDAYREAFAEQAGGDLIGRAAGVVAKKGLAAIPEKTQNYLASLFKAPIKGMNRAGQVMESAGISGLAGEFGEERLSEILGMPLGLADGKMAEYGGLTQALATGDLARAGELASVEAATLGVLVGGPASVGAISGAIESAKSQAERERLAQLLANPPEELKAMLSSIPQSAKAAVDATIKRFMASPSRKNLSTMRSTVNSAVTKPVEPQTDPNFGMTPESAPDAGDETLPEQQTQPAQQTPENFSPEQNVVTATEQRTDVKENRQEGQGNQEGLLTQSNLEPEPFARQPLASTAAEQQPPGGSGLRGAELDENRATTKALAVGASLSPDEQESLAELVTTLSGMPKEAVQLQIVNSGLASTMHQNDLHFFSESISQGGGKEAADTLRKSAVRQREKLLEENNNEPQRILSEISRLQELIKDVSAKTISPTYVSTDPHTGHSVVLKKSESRLIAAEESKRKAIKSASEKIDELTTRLEEIKNSSQTTELAPAVQQSAPAATSEPILVGPSTVTVGKADPLQAQASELVSRGSTVGGIQKELGVGFQRATDLHNAAQQPAAAAVEPAKPQYTPVQTPPEQMTVDQIQRELGNKPSPSRMEELTRSLESKRSRVPESQGSESVATTPDVAQVKPAAPFVAKETPNESNPVSVAPIASQQPSVSPNAAKEYAPIVMSTPASQAPPVASQAVTPVEKAPAPAMPDGSPVQRQVPRPQGAGLGARRRETPAPGGMSAQPAVQRPQVQAPPTTWQEAFERFTKKASPATVPREQATAAARTAAERLERFTGVTAVIVHSDDNQAMTAAMHIPMGERKSVILINNRVMADSENVTDEMVWRLVGDELTHATGIDAGNWLDREELADWSKRYLQSVPDWYREQLLNDPVQLKKEATAMWLSNTFFQDADVQQALFNTNPSVWKQIVDLLLSIFNAKPSLEKSLSPKQFAIYKALTQRLVQENGPASDADSGSYTFEKLLSDYKRIGGLNDEQVEAMRSIWEGFARNVAKMKNANEFVAKYIKGMSEANVEGQVGILMQPAYQGSGKLFEKHSSEHFGTGEGHAAYGVGHYFTDDKGVAGHYREVATRNQGNRESAKHADSRTASKHNISTETVEYLGTGHVSPRVLGFMRDDALQYAKEYEQLANRDVDEVAKQYAGTSSYDIAEDELREAFDMWQSYRRVAEDIDHLIKSGKEYKPVKPGVIYQVELAPTDDELFLWDKPISQQPAKVKDAMGKIAERYGLRIPAVSAKQRYWTGEDFYKALATALAFINKPSAEASRKIREIDALSYDIDTATITEDDGAIYTKISKELKEWINNFLGKQVVTNSEYNPGHYRVEMSGSAFSNMLKSFSIELEYERKSLLPLLMTEKQQYKLASETLLHYGVRGNKHYTRDTRTGRSQETKYNYVIFSDDDVEITAVYLQRDGQANGAVRLWEDGSALLYSFKTANFSTHVHEFAHIARQHLTGDDAVLANTYVGATSNDWSEEQEEKFANGFERFLREGNIEGTNHMRSLWERMKSWMVGIYQTITRGSRLDIVVSKEVQKVYAKMIGAEPGAKFEELKAQLTEEGDAFAAMINRELTPEFSVDSKGRRNDPKENVYSQVAMSVARRWEQESDEKRQELAADTEEGQLARARYAGKSVSNAMSSLRRKEEEPIKAGGTGRKVALSEEGKQFKRLYDGQPIPGDIRYLREGLDLAAKEFQKLSPEKKALLLSNKQERNQFVREANDSWVSGKREVFTEMSLDFENPVTGTSLAGEIADTRELSPEEAAEKKEFIEFAQEIATDVGDDPAVIMGFDALIKTDKSTPGHISKAEYARRKNIDIYELNKAIKKANNRKAQIQAAKGIGSPTMSPGYAALLNNAPPPPPNQTLNGDTVVHGTQAIRKRIEQGPLKLTIGLGKPRSFDPTTGEKAPAEYKRTGEYATFLANTIGYARLIAHEVGHHISNTTTVFNFMGTKARIDIGHIITQAANHNAAMPGQDMTKFITRLQRRGANPETIKAVAERRYNDAMNEAIRQFGTPTLDQRLAMDDLRGLDPMVVTFTNPNHPLHRPKSRGNIEEGFAEFMRHVAEGDAATVAPKAYAQYVAWAQTQPEVAKEVESVMKMLGDYLRASPNQKMKTQIASDGHAANAAESTMKDRGIDYVRSLKDGIAQEVDQSSVLRTLQQMVDERGHIKRPGQLGIVTAFNVLFGSAAKHGTRAFLDGVHYIHNTQYDVKVSGLSFDQEMMAAGLTIDEQDTLVEFMLAQQKLEIEDKINSVRRANGQKEYVDTDLSLDDARTIIAEVRKNPELYNKFLHLHDVYVRVYRDLYDMYSKATGLPAMETPLDKYVALKRVFDDNGSLSEQGRSFTTPKTPFKSRTLGGATLPIVHPFDSLRRDINKFYDLATQHQFWTTVYNATDSARGGADGMDPIVQRMPHDVEVTKDTLEKLFPDMAKQLLAAGVSQQAIDEIDTNPFAMQVVVTMFKIIHQPSAAKGEVVHIETDYYDPATGQVVPLSKPRLVTYKWNKDMYSMLSQLGMSWKQTDIARKVPWVFNTFNFFSKTFKKFAINRNPEFALRGRVHDQMQFMERSKETSVAERFTAPLLADADITKYRTKAITGHYNAITEMFMFDVGSMASQGGERSRSIEGDVVHMRTKSSIKAGENNLGYRTVDALASADHAFQVGLSFMEMAPRLAEYKAAIRNDGYSVDKDGHVIETATGQRTQLPYDVRMRATSAAMDVTINFAHAGPWVQLAETIFPLFSAAVTSQKQKFAYRAEMVKGLLKGDKKAMGWAAVVTGFIAAGMAEYLMYRDDEEWNEQEYWQRRQWVDLGWFRLLKGRDTGIFTNAGVAIAAAIDGNWDASYGMLSSDIMGQRVPFADEIPAPRPILDVGYEVWANKDLFTGKPIDTDVETKNLLPGDRGVGRTATTSQAMGYATGYSPNMIEHVLNRISGGAYERTMKGADSATGFANDVIKGKETKSWRAKDIPMVGQFVDWNPHRRSEAEMKEAAARTEQSIGSHKLRAPKEGDDATLWNARNTDLHNASYRYDRANKMRGELYSLWREAKGDTAKQSEIMALITGTARAALKKEGAAKFPNPFAPNTMIPEYARPAVKKELIDVLNKATENLITESRKKKNDASDMQIIAARQLLKENGWTVPQLEGLLNEAMPKWTEAKRNRLMLLRRVMQ